MGSGLGCGHAKVAKIPGELDNSTMLFPTSTVPLCTYLIRNLGLRVEA